MPVSVDFLSSLYNRSSCYADRLSAAEIDAINVPTVLEEAVRKALLAKKDVVLLGNPGDGKTHLFARLRDVIERVKADVVLDATAEKDYERIARRWKAASAAKRPFCLAINQGPLNQLLLEQGTGLPQLGELGDQLKTLLYYDDVPSTPKRVFAVDLNLRSVLTPDIVHHALQNLLKPEILDACPECFADATTDVALNRRALLHPQVRDRLVKLLVAASHAGRHISMRDLQGFLSYVIFGGRTIREMVKDPSNRDYRYFNRCFQGVGELFDAVRDVFEPERATLPELDEHLWENTGVHDGWLFGRPPLTPDHLEDAWDQFTTLKRQYYFEHADGERLLALRQEDGSSSLSNVIAAGAAGIERNLPVVLKALNIFFCPDRDEEGMHLRLWGAQHYDGRTPRVMASCYSIPKEKFALQLPKLAPWLTDAIEYSPDHVLLRYKEKSPRPVGLRINHGLWRALMLAGRGLPFSLRSPEYSQAIQTFLTRLYPLDTAHQALDNVYLFNLGSNRVSRVMVDHQNGTYAQP
jgi:hypothetical protein